MKKYPILVKKHPIATGIHTSERRKGRVIEASGDPAVPVGFARGPFLSFRYSYTEITTGGGTARVKAHRARYENGRLESERFEGELDRNDYERMLAEAQRHFAEQTASLFRSAFSLFPMWGRLRSEED